MKGERLLDLIRQSPDDDGPRLVYADWLADQGYPERADLIRAQVAAARIPWTEPAGIAPRRTARALLDQHSVPWLASLHKHPGIRLGHFERGFVSQAAAHRFADLVEQSEAIAELPSITTFSTRWPRRGDNLGELHLPPTLHTLSLEGVAWDETAVERLADAPWLGRIRHLNIDERYERPGGTGEWIATLLASPHLRQLERLRLVPVHDRLVPALVELDLPHLTSLELVRDGHPLDQDLLDQLLTWPVLDHLERLDLTGVSLSRVDGLRLFGSSRLGAVRELGLPRGLDGIELPAQLPSGMRPTQLQLGSNRLVGLHGLEHAEWLSDVVELTVGRLLRQPDSLMEVRHAPFADTLRVWWRACGELDRVAQTEWPSLHALDIVSTDRELTVLDQAHGLDGLRYLAFTGSPHVQRQIEQSHFPELQWYQTPVAPVSDGPLARVHVA